jgi:DNA-binding transcriptional LysR family regulator
MHIRDLDLNLLRVFDAVYRQRSVSRAAEVLALSQPAVSQALTRLRLLMKDALFIRVAGGVMPTPGAVTLARSVQQALLLLEQGLNEVARFDPKETRRTFRIHMSDIGEAEFLPALMHRVRRDAPGVTIETQQLDYAAIENALDSGKIDFAFGYHPLLTARPSPESLARLDYIVVRHHTETARVLERMALSSRIRLSIPHFMVIPAIVGATDLAVVLPMRIAVKFAKDGGFRIAQPRWSLDDFVIALHWSRRAESDPAGRWLRALAVELFREPVRRGEARR